MSDVDSRFDRLLKVMVSGPLPRCTKEKSSRSSIR